MVGDYRIDNVCTYNILPYSQHSAPLWVHAVVGAPFCCWLLGRFYRLAVAYARTYTFRTHNVAVCHRAHIHNTNTRLARMRL